ncbi:MAG TPA: response regulator [Moraxellaceae bacterium]|nr:response regulator [Moraxellaceae bacterium]
MAGHTPMLGASRPAIPQGDPPLRILVVDDSEAIRVFMRAKLKSLANDHHLDLHVETAPSGEEAVACCDNHAYDLVFMDVVMPGIGGIEACRRIKARHNVPITMVSSLRAQEDHDAARAAGCDNYLDKPVKDADLQAAVREAAIRAQRRQ